MISRLVTSVRLVSSFLLQRDHDLRYRKPWHNSGMVPGTVDGLDIGDLISHI
jgi:hypothetical protein